MRRKLAPRDQLAELFAPPDGLDVAPAAGAVVELAAEGAALALVLVLVLDSEPPPLFEDEL
jgi:hypothetical protein